MPKGSLANATSFAPKKSIAQESDYVNSKFSISEENSSENTGSTEDTESADVSEIDAESDLTDAAYEEVVADALETVLSDGNVLEDLATYDKTLWEKVKAWIKEKSKKSDRLKWTLSKRTARGHIPTMKGV